MDTCVEGSGLVVPPASVGYTSARNDSSACTWETTKQPGQVLVLHISFSGTFRHEWIEKCTLAYVDIVQSNSNHRRDRFCGNTNPQYYQYIDGGVRIRFVTHMKGVQLNVLAYNRDSSTLDTCPTEQNPTVYVNPGTLEPFGSANYSHSLQCYWRITSQSPRKNVRFEITEIDVEDFRQCSADSLSVYDGETISKSRLLGKFCGNEKPPVLWSSTSTLHVVFESDNTHEGKGFKAKFDFVSSDTRCPSKYLPKYLISPTSLMPFGLGVQLSDMECHWIVTTPSGHNGMILTLMEFLMDEGVSCSEGRLSIYEITPDSETPLGEYCKESENQRIVFSASGQVRLVFRLTGTAASKGFWMSFNLRPAKCEEVLMSPSGMIKTSSYPASYFPDEHCTWHIQGPRGKVIKLTFMDIDLGDSGDYVEILEPSDIAGVVDRRQRIDKMMSNPYLSSSNKLLVKFRSNNAAGGRGFMAVYDSITAPPVCGGVSNGGEGVISSLDVVINPPHRDCEWIIKAGEGKVLKITFSSLKMQPAFGNSACSYEYVEIRDGATSADLLIGRYCGDALPRDILTSTNEAYVKYHSDHLVNGRRFRLSYKETEAICGGYLTGHEVPFKLTSPRFPRDYPYNVRCKWTVQPLPGDHLVAYVTEIALESSVNCRYDYLEIKSNKNQTTVLRACGTDYPPEFLIDDGVDIYFVADSTISKKGFSMTVTSTRFPKTAELGYTVTYSEPCPNATNFQTDIKTMFRETFFKQSLQPLCVSPPCEFGDTIIICQPNSFVVAFRSLEDLTMYDEQNQYFANISTLISKLSRDSTFLELEHDWFEGYFVTPRKNRRRQKLIPTLKVTCRDKAPIGYQCREGR
ncbi:cubilin-like [Lingula anatina]|uniref:Cubilin-like n=1 Tax=Lingula anatina TaxID=7574 RepID=A0A2R2MT52_LINAN|nr:cubilin-like [Lingula anatina]|eukprot:XP_023933202.1 cubilin-like [Lingula anatina]